MKVSRPSGKGKESDDWDADAWFDWEEGKPTIPAKPLTSKEFYESALDGPGLIDRRLVPLDLWKVIDQIPLGRLAKCSETEKGPCIHLYNGEEYLDVVVMAMRQHQKNYRGVSWPGNSSRCYLRIDQDEYVTRRIPIMGKSAVWKCEAAWRSDTNQIVVLQYLKDL